MIAGLIAEHEWICPTCGAVLDSLTAYRRHWSLEHDEARVVWNARGLKAGGVMPREVPPANRLLTLHLRCEWCKELFAWTPRTMGEGANFPRCCSVAHASRLRSWQIDRATELVPSPAEEIARLS